MLRLIVGRGGTGKTELVMAEIARRAKAGEKSVLIVPEQYSHDAERQLCAYCGNGISLFAEVLSFTGLFRRALARVPREERPLDAGGRLLVMELAFSAVLDQLTVLSHVRRHADFLTGLLRLRDELNQSLLTPAMLLEAARESGGALEEKVGDLALILESYPGFIPPGYYDPSDAMRETAALVEESGVLEGAAVFLDGFSDFTPQEMAVAETILGMGSELTVCLNTDWPEEDELLFHSAHDTASRLRGLAEAQFQPFTLVRTQGQTRSDSGELQFLEKHLFSGEDCTYEGEKRESIRLFVAENPTQECEAAAALILDRIREKSWRWRDFAVTARGWESYDAIAESIFEKFGVPVFRNRRSSLLEKPVLSMTLSALGAVENGFAYEDVFRYLKTGLAGITPEECDELENYVLRWRIRGRRLWTGEAGWSSDPVGMGRCTPQNRPRLDRINEIRARAAAPLEKLAAGLEAGETAREKAVALWRFLEEAGVPERLRERSEELTKGGELQLAEEYLQLWDILVDALEEFAGVLGDALISDEEFTRLLRLVLSAADVGTIPAALDRVSMGEMDRMRKRDLKCLIVLGATDDRLPAVGPVQSLLSDEERGLLMRFGLKLSETAESRLYREMDLIYSSLTLPSEELILLRTGEEGVQPSFVVDRISRLFHLPSLPVEELLYTAAPVPCFELAARAAGGERSPVAVSALRVLEGEEDWARKLRAAGEAARMGRGRLDARRAEALYGRNTTLTASRVESFYRCRHAYFLQYGLQAQPRKKADFDRPEFGTFVHFVLENVLKELEEGPGFEVPEEKVKELTEKYIEAYTREYLGGLEGRSARFRYLYRRLSDPVSEIVRDTVEELASSDFRPLDFELDFSRGGDLPPAEIRGEDWQVAVRGKVDRVDGWLHEGKLYLRVVDYKTGVKKFDLSDVLGGMSMQMLIYLFVLERFGEGRYHAPVVPAGVLYTPARESVIPAESSATREEIDLMRAKNLKRSGLILDDAEVLQAMEHGENPRYIPVKYQKSGAKGSLASLERMGVLKRHIDSMLLEMGRELHGGDITASPFYRGERENACAVCAYQEACRFGEAPEDRRHWMMKLDPEEAWQEMGE